MEISASPPSPSAISAQLSRWSIFNRFCNRRRRSLLEDWKTPSFTVLLFTLVLLSLFARVPTANLRISSIPLTRRTATETFRGRNHSEGSCINNVHKADLYIISFIIRNNQTPKMWLKEAGAPFQSVCERGTDIPYRSSSLRI